MPKIPEKNKRNILITSALPYVNNVPHLGNIIGCVLSADVWSKYCRSRNYNSIYICGTDEYGTATETKANSEGLKEREICNKYNEIHQLVYKWFNIDFDYFGRTSTPNPKEDLNWNQTIIAQDIFKKLVNNDLLIEKTIQQLFCIELNSFLADRYVSGICPHCGYEKANGDQCDNCGKLLDPLELINPFCKVDPKYKIEKRSTEHLYLDLSKLQDKLKEWFENDHQNWSKTAISITKNWKISYMTNYDFVDKEFSFTSINIGRDLHCWQMSFNWIPIGFMRSYNLNINVKSSILQDLRLQRRRTWYDNGIRWC